MDKLLILLNVVFAAFLAYQWDGFAVEPAATGEVVERDIPVENETISGEEGDVPPFEQFSAVAERPLFIEDRRPPVEEEEVIEETPAPAPPPARRPALKLTAILVVDNQPQALFISAGKKEGLQKLSLGDEIEGWVVSGINSKQVTFKRGRHEEVFILREYDKVPLPNIPTNPPKKSADPKVKGKKGNGADQPKQDNGTK